MLFISPHLKTIIITLEENKEENITMRLLFFFSFIDMYAFFKKNLGDVLALFVCKFLAGECHVMLIVQYLTNFLV